jgi:protein-S-isoprenylcysteine O-methyltransferase Ste14
MKNFLRHLSAFTAPVVMGILFPYLIIRYEHRNGSPFEILFSSLTAAGFLILVAGLIFFLATVWTFISIGRGTIMPWDPTRKLVIVGMYRYVRNPMILSLIILLVGEAMVFASYGIAILAAVFFVINTVYFMYSEEPGLVKRFGEEYIEYKKNVPRWISRLKPWRMDKEK